MSIEILKNKPPRSEDVQAWLQAEVEEQLANYERIKREMNIDLADERERWIAAFNERIQTTGFFWHADNKRIIKREEIYPKPDREFKVVF